VNTNRYKLKNVVATPLSEGKVLLRDGIIFIINTIHQMKGLLIAAIALLAGVVSCGEKDDIEVAEDDIDIVGKDGFSLDSLTILSSNLPNLQYRDLIFMDEATGFAVATRHGINEISAEYEYQGLVAKTADGGITWTITELPIRNAIPQKIQFIDTQTGYIIAGDNTFGVLFKTTDGGQSWNTIYLDALACPHGMCFLDYNTGFITGKGLFGKTTDGGATWTSLKSANVFYYYDVNFKNGHEGIVTAQNGIYFKTTDGGHTWDSSKCNTFNYWLAIHFVDSKMLATDNVILFDLNNNKEIISLPITAKLVFFDSKQSIAAGYHYKKEGFFPYGDIMITNDGWRTYARKTLSTVSSQLPHAIARMSDSKVMVLYPNIKGTEVILLKK
jgi:photosystem II stability/assembly factor-like uncharacterized protein